MCVVRSFFSRCEHAYYHASVDWHVLQQAVVTATQTYAHIHLLTRIYMHVQYTPEQYGPLLDQAVMIARQHGCGCAQSPPDAVHLQAQCPCVQKEITALRQKGDAIKQALAQVVRAAAKAKGRA